MNPPPDVSQGNGMEDLGLSPLDIIFYCTFDPKTGDTRSIQVKVAPPSESDVIVEFTYDLRFSELQTKPEEFDLMEEEYVLDLDPYYLLMQAGQPEQIPERFFQDLEDLDQDYSF
ncbi:MAG: hypothetical protein GY747_14220 [Planctomycetes bacterium]|nr:hypothetical protein [Planctomycetota bacterium]MCP4770588.1 hypothetical protein [Planctomycetota bacterium]MCP4861083.1 hypothetical protein [Planctomycetota bacterium]